MKINSRLLELSLLYYDLTYKKNNFIQYAIVFEINIIANYQVTY